MPKRETFLPLDALITVTEETLQTGGSDRQTYGGTAVSVKPPATEQRSTLLRNVLELTARLEDAIREFELVTAHNGVQRIIKASNKLSLARNELMEAHRRLDQFAARP